MKRVSVKGNESENNVRNVVTLKATLGSGGHKRKKIKRERKGSNSIYKKKKQKRNNAKIRQLTTSR